MSDADGMTGWWCVGCDEPKTAGPRPGVGCPTCGHCSVSSVPFSQIGRAPSPQPEIPTLSALMPGHRPHPR